MTCQQTDFTLPAELLEQIAEQGFDALPELIRIVINDAMRLERQNYLGVAPYQRSPERRGRASLRAPALRSSPSRLPTRAAREPRRRAHRPAARRAGRSNACLRLDGPVRAVIRRSNTGWHPTAPLSPE